MISRSRCSGRDIWTLKYDLGYEDFDAFFNSKMEWHEEAGANYDDNTK